MPGCPATIRAYLHARCVGGGELQVSSPLAAEGSDVLKSPSQTSAYDFTLVFNNYVPFGAAKGGSSGVSKDLTFRFIRVSVYTNWASL